MKTKYVHSNKSGKLHHGDAWWARHGDAATGTTALPLTRQVQVLKRRQLSHSLRPQLGTCRIAQGPI